QTVTFGQSDLVDLHRTGTAPWPDSPTPILQAGGASSLDTHLAAGPGGKAAETWIAGSDLFLSIRNASGVWGSPVQVDESPPSFESVIASDLTYDSLGNAVVVWVLSERISPDANEMRTHVYARTRSAAGTLGPIQSLYVVPVSTDGLAQKYIGTVRSTVDSEGHVRAVWMTEDSQGFQPNAATGPAQLRTALLTSPGGDSWTVPDAPIASAGEPYDEWQMASDGAGNVSFIWFNRNLDTNQRTLYYAPLPSGVASIGSPSVVATDDPAAHRDFFTAIVRVNPAGAAVVGWLERTVTYDPNTSAATQSEELKARSRSTVGADLGPAATVASGVDNGDLSGQIRIEGEHPFDFAINSDGDALAVWSKDTGYQQAKLQSSRRPSGGSWNAPQDVEASPSGQAMWPLLEAGPDNSFDVVWTSIFGGTDLRLFAARGEVGSSSGPSDSDGDGVSDSSDQCQNVAGPGPSGCPTHPRTLTISYSTRADAFKGVLSGDPAACISGKTVTLWKVHDGPDAKKGSDSTDSTGHYKIPKAEPTGRYYAKVKQVTIPSAGICSAVHSKTIAP
ncbi:MAG: hypothetical protein QOH90_1880, partial [Actinomycetota bacterium]|nr:hypothetical protein [Actinomycetota bacterium]